LPEQTKLNIFHEDHNIDQLVLLHDDTLAVLLMGYQSVDFFIEKIDQMMNWSSNPNESGESYTKGSIKS